MTVKLKPGAKQERIRIGDNDLLEISVKAPPVDGKANTALIKLLSKRLKVPKTSIEIIMGQTNREKVLSLETIDMPTVRERLSS